MNKSNTQRKVLFAAAAPILFLFGAGIHSQAADKHLANQIYWGGVHGHTSLSDGKGSLDDYFIHAREAAKLDFVIVTDHDFGNGPPGRMPRGQWTLTQEKADDYTVNGRFVAIAGYEWTSQPKYWTDVGKGEVSERHFLEPPTFFNHKNVYFPSRVDYLFSSKDAAYNSPDLLAKEVLKQGGLIHNNPLSETEKDQFEYDPSHSAVIANTEMRPDVSYHKGKTWESNVEQMLRNFLNKGGKTGFVAGIDTHEGKPVARTVVLARRSSTRCGTVAIMPLRMTASFWTSRSTATSWAKRLKSKASLKLCWR